MDIALLLLFQLLLIALNAIFACAEIAVLSVSEAKLDKLAEEGKKSAKRLKKLTADPAKFLATIQVAITLSGFLGSAFAAENFSGYIVDWAIGLGIPATYEAAIDKAAVVLITLILSYVTLIFGELVPKRIAMKKSEQIALGISGLIRIIAFLFTPVVWLLSKSTNLVLRVCGIDPNEVEEEVSEEDIRLMVDAGSEKGTIDHQEKEFIQNVFEFNDTDAGEISTHRTDVTLLWMEDDAETWDQIIHESRHTRYPVCDESADNIVGILNAKDYYRLQDKSRESVMQNAVFPAYFVPETVKADVLFNNMRSTRNSIAVVLDEYGGMVGIVTLNDLIEVLVGSLNDEPEGQSAPEASVDKIDEDTYKLTGNVPLSLLEEAMEITFDTADYDTFTGLAFDTLGTVPDDGELTLEIELPKAKMDVSCVVDRHQIEEATVRLTRVVEDEDDEDDDKKKDKE